MNYHDPQTLLKALLSLDDLWEESKHEEHADLRDAIEAQWPGFQIGDSEALGEYGLFPRRWTIKQREEGAIERRT